LASRRCCIGTADRASDRLPVDGEVQCAANLCVVERRRTRIQEHEDDERARVRMEPASKTAPQACDFRCSTEREVGDVCVSPRHRRYPFPIRETELQHDFLHVSIRPGRPRPLAEVRVPDEPQLSPWRIARDHVGSGRGKRATAEVPERRPRGDGGHEGERQLRRKIRIGFRQPERDGARLIVGDNRPREIAGLRLFAARRRTRDRCIPRRIDLVKCKETLKSSSEIRGPDDLAG
jgi:hypothetical protein